MAKEKKSFFERLTGSVRVNDDNDIVEERDTRRNTVINNSSINNTADLIEEEKEGELTVDVYQTPEMIVLKTMIAGVRPEDLDISITRDMISIKGRREEEKIVRDEDYFARELYWGMFSRTISLPSEIDVDEAEAVEKEVKVKEIPKEKEEIVELGAEKKEILVKKEGDIDIVTEIKNIINSEIRFLKVVDVKKIEN